jgi:hypothetical protein
MALLKITPQSDVCVWCPDGSEMEDTFLGWDDTDHTARARIRVCSYLLTT